MAGLGLGTLWRAMVGGSQIRPELAPVVRGYQPNGGGALFDPTSGRVSLEPRSSLLWRRFEKGDGRRSGLGAPFSGLLHTRQSMTNGLLDTLNDISTSLATLALQVRADALAGLGARNKVAEHVLLPVLRRLYGAPGLANANSFAANVAGIDLYDPSSRLWVRGTVQ